MKKTKALENWQIEDAKRLKELFASNKQYSQAEFGAKYDIGNQGYVWQLLNGKRPLSIKTAKAFSIGLGVSIETFSPKIAAKIESASKQVKDGQSLEFAGQVKNPVLLPVAGIAQLGENGWYDEIEANGTEGYVEHYSDDENAYALRVRGDSMYPAIRNGWYVVVEPSMSVSGGIYAAIALSDGRKMVKEVLYETQREYVLQSVNGGERLSVPREEIQTIHGVAAVVAPGKHKS